VDSLGATALEGVVDVGVELCEEVGHKGGIALEIVGKRLYASAA